MVWLQNFNLISSPYTNQKNDCNSPSFNFFFCIHINAYNTNTYQQEINKDYKK